MTDPIIIKSVALAGVWLCVACSILSKNVSGQGVIFTMIVALVMTGVMV